MLPSTSSTAQGPTTQASSMVDDQELPFRTQISKWTVLVSLALVAISLSEVEAFENVGNSEGSGDGEFHVAPATGRIHDSFGRERIFHGLNVVMKGAPWHPRIDAFDPQLSFTDEDVALMQEWGMNVVRLGIMWPGVEPRRDQVNSTYLEIMQTIVSKLHSAGVFTLLEFHQDLYASQFCGEGLPSWILDDDHITQRHFLPFHEEETPAVEIEQSSLSNYAVSTKEEEEEIQVPAISMPSSLSKRLLRFSNQGEQSKLSQLSYPASFPEPLGKRWPWEEDDGEPSAERCSEHTWWRYYFSYAVSKAFQDLYDNKYGWGDLLARYWSVVAGAFKGQPGVLGYELMNEPWAGNIFANPLLLLPGVADAKNLVRFYEKLQDAVRSVDSAKLIFFETITFDNFWCGLSTVPGGEKWKSKTVMSYHYYTPPNFSAEQAFAERLRESKRLGCGSMLTEFFVSTELDVKVKGEFRELKNDVLRNALGAKAENPRPRVDEDSSSCDQAAKDTLELSYTKNTLSSCAKLSSEACPQELAKIGEHRDQDSGPKPPQPSHDQEIKAKSILKGAAKRGEELERRRNDAPRRTYEKHRRVLVRAEKQDSEQETAKEEADSVDVVLSAADKHVQSWIAWEYKAFYIKTGSIVEQSMFNGDGELNVNLAKKLARAYPQAVCGNIISFSFDPTSSLFDLTYTAGGACHDGVRAADTEIFIHRQFYYPNGLSVTVSHSCASVSETDRTILVKHTIDCFGLVIVLRIRRVDPAA